MTDSIYAFWDYVAHNINDVVISDLEKNLPTIFRFENRPLSEYALALNTSGLIYVRMSALFKCAASNVHFILCSNYIAWKDSDEINQAIVNAYSKVKLQPQDISQIVNSKKVFVRFWLILTGDPDAVSRIYDIGSQYIMPINWQIVKHLPPKYPEIKVVNFTTPVGDKHVVEDNIRYVLRKNELLLVVKLEQINRETLLAVEKVVSAGLIALLGEHYYLTHIKKIMAISDDFLINVPFAVPHLRPISEFCAELIAGGPVEWPKQCSICTLTENNVPIHGDPHMCDYCMARTQQLLNF